MTTIKELYEWAVKHNVENLPVGLQFQDTEFTPDYEVSASIEKSGDDEYVLLA